MKRLNFYAAFMAVFSLSFLEGYPVGININSQSSIADRLSLGYSGCEENSCMNSSSLQLYNRCLCDESCSFYGDCCFDALSRESTKRIKQVECLSLPFTFINVYAIASCPKNWSGPLEINERCISPDDYEEYIESFLPVTDPVTKLTYRNRFCAACNENNDTVEWLVNFRCLTYNIKQKSLDEDSVIRSLAYNETLRTWGFFHEEENEEKFISCYMTYLVPEEEEKKPVLCKKMDYSECSESWTNDEVRQLCNDFLDPVYVFGIGWYRNIYCAHCNYEVKGYLCRKPFRPASGTGILFHSTLNLKVKFEDFKNIREESCGLNEKYDKNFKKCRKIRL